MGKNLEDIIDYLRMRKEADLSKEQLLAMMEVASFVAGISVDEMETLVEEK